MSQPADLPPHRDPPYSRHAKLIAGHVLALERRHTYVRRNTRPEPVVRRWTRGSSWQPAQGWVLRPLCAGDSREKRRSPSTTEECFRRVASQVRWKSETGV